MKIKVVHIIVGLGDGGAEAVMCRLCLNSPDVEHVVISMQGEGKYGKVLKEFGIILYCLKLGPNPFSLFNLYKLPKLLKKENPDVVQTWMYHADFFGGLAAKWVGIRNICWGIRHSVLDPKKTKIMTFILARLCAFLSVYVPRYIICCADKSVQAHIGLGYDARKMVKIHNGFDLLEFSPNASAREEIRKTLHINDSIFLLGNVGRFDPNKDHQNLLIALSFLKKNGLNFICLLVGSGMVHENRDLVDLVTDLNLENEVRLLGPRDDIPSIMNALDLHVTSSSSEGFPNVVAEAMACETVSVSTDVGDVGEILVNGDCVCPTRDHKALAKLISIMECEWRLEKTNWEQRQKNCRSLIKENFTLRIMVDAYVDTWKSLNKNLN